MINSFNRYIVLIFLLSAFEVAFSQGIGFKELNSRDSVKQPFLYLKNQSPIASVILFQGGNGVIGASGSEEKGWSRNDKAFLSGGIKRFADNGVTVALLDKPSDKSDLNSFRTSSEHLADIQTVINFLKKDNPNTPIWLIGTSNGSLSAANAAATLGKDVINGIVLTSSVTVPHHLSLGQKYVHPVTLAKLDQIETPVLLVHHVSDKCAHSPFQPMNDLKSNFSKSPKVEMFSIEGGQNGSNPCDGGYHQYQGQEIDVTKQIVDWIKAAK